MSNKNRNILLLIVVTLQVIFFIVWSLMEYKKLSDPKAQDILVKIIPIDPDYLISGNYFILRYEFSNTWRFKRMMGWKFKRMMSDLHKGRIIYAVLEKKDSYYTPKYISVHQPKKIKENQVIIKGNIENSYNLKYGIEKYFINANTRETNSLKDKIIEKYFINANTREHNSYLKDKVEVLITIDESFSARIKKLYVNDKEFDQSKYKK